MKSCSSYYLGAEKFVKYISKILYALFRKDELVVQCFNRPEAMGIMAAVIFVLVVNLFVFFDHSANSDVSIISIHGFICLAGGINLYLPFKKMSLKFKLS